VALNSTSTLVLQTISNVITATQVITASNLSTSTITVNYYSVSRNPVDWTTKRGWYIQWPNSGQRVIYPPETLLGRIVAVDTMTPISAVADDPCLQTNRGRAWNYVIEALTGRGPSTNVFDTNGNQAVELTDLAVSGYENTADGRTRYLRNTTRSTGLNTVFTPLSTQQLPETWISCSTLGTCAFVNRTWRQLYLR
jgi:type IV pilus assembly protein PilY1